MSFAVLAVCTGNVCRSPAAEMMLRHGIRGLAGLTGPDCIARSAGVSALVGQPMATRMVAALDDGGIPTTSFTARQLDASMIDEADLIITADRRHRAAVVGINADALERTFTLREFGRYCGKLLDAQLPETVGVSEASQSGGSLRPLLNASRDPRIPVRASDSQAQRFSDLLQFVTYNRGLVHPIRPQDDDVADPWNRSRRAHRAAVQVIETNVAVILSAAAGR